MSETGTLITYLGVAFLSLALSFVYTAFAKANHEYEGEELIMVLVTGVIFWPVAIPIAMIVLCVILILWPIAEGNDALARYIRRKSKD